jgi:ferric-dicitrate binding protein FerR (iron transport regulator)
MYGLAVMVVGTAIIVGIHQQMPPKAVIKPALPGVDDDEVVTRILKVEGQPVINLDAVKDSVNIKDAIIYIYGDTLSLKGGTEDMVAMLMTPYGVESYIELADKTVGWVAPGTAIQFQLSNNNTERELAVNGEVFLSIAKDADRPFIVQVPNGTINVLGTSFGVNTIENDSVVVSLTEGKVRMITAADALTLHPGEAVHLTQNQPLNPVPFDSAGLLRRQQGVYTFQDATLSDIADVIYRVRHIFSTVMPQVIDKRYSGEINMRAPVKKILADVKRTVPGFDYEVAIHSRGDTLLRFFGK